MAKKAKNNKNTMFKESKNLSECKHKLMQTQSIMTTRNISPESLERSVKHHVLNKRAMMQFSYG